MMKKVLTLMLVALLTLSPAMVVMAEGGGFFEQLGAMADTLLSELDTDEIQKEIEEIFDKEEIAQAWDELKESIDPDNLFGGMFSEENIRQFINEVRENLTSEEITSLISKITEASDEYKDTMKKALEEGGSIREALDSLSEKGDNIAELINSLRDVDGSYNVDEIIELAKAYVEARKDATSLVFHGIVVTHEEIHQAAKDFFHALSEEE